MTKNSSANKIFHITALVTAINVLTSSGFSIAGLITANTVTTQAALIFAMYGAARALSLAVITLVIIYRRSTQALVVIGILAGVIQAVDSLIGLYQNDFSKFFGPLVLAVLQLVAVRSLHKSARY